MLTQTLALTLTRYYEAYRHLHGRIEAAAATGLKHRLQPGEMAVFNNRRMLHGRHGFRQRGVARRHLRGCYVNIDEFANRYNHLARRHGAAAEAEAAAGSAPGAAAAARRRPPHLGNQDWAAGCTTLAPAV